MTNFQKAVCVFLSLCFFAVLAAAPGPYFLWDNVYRQLPLYCFVEKEARRIPEAEDPETSERMIESNTLYLAEGRQAEQIGEENIRYIEGESEEIQDGEAENGKAEKDQEGASEIVEEDGKSRSSGEDGEEMSEKEEEKSGESGKKGGGKRQEDDTEGEEAGEKDGSDEIDGSRGDDVGTSDENEGVKAGEKAEENPAENENETAEEDFSGEIVERPGENPEIDLSPEALADYDYLLNQFYIVDSGTSASPELLSAERFLAADMALQKDVSVPQILIYHSHSQEAFADSREGEPEDTIVGVGNYLTELLTETYGYQVIHVTETFDIIDGEVDRSRAYDFAREYLDKVLEENPTVEVIIDLHRDGVPDDRHLVTEINGKPTAQVMFFNGISYTNNNGTVDYLPNPYIQDNLAFSFQLEYQSALHYPDFYRGIYLAGLRYNLHLRPRALLLEAGAQTNTVQEVKNAMEPFAEILDRVLSGAEQGER